MIDGTEIVKRYDKLRSERMNFDRRWESMAPFLAPSRIGIIVQRSPGVKQTRQVYDSTTMMAAEMMAMFIAGHIINPSQRWAGFELADTEIGQQDETREWLEECRDIWLRWQGRSLFYAEGPESLIDYGGFGTGFLLCEEAPQPTNRAIRGFRGFYYQAVKTGRFVISEGPDGLVDTAIFEHELSARIVMDRWGEEGPPYGPSEPVRQACAKTPDKPIKVLHAILPRPRPQQGEGARGMPWASCWVERETKQVLSESGYRFFPAAVPRYHKTPGEVYGRGRGDLAFPDTWTLNSAKRMGLEDWALKIRPPILARHDSVIGTLRLTPGAPTSINTRGMAIRDTLMAFDTGSHPEVSHIKEEELRKSIRQIFFVEQIQQLMEVNKSEMTAYEFAKKIELLFRLMGPVYGRLEWEYLHRVVDVGFDLLYHAGAFPPPPPVVLQSSGLIDVVFQNPIAKAQRGGDAEALLLAVNDLAPIGQQFPQMWDRLDPDKTADGILALRGVPAAWTRNDDEMKALRTERAKQQQAELAMRQASEAAQAAGQAAPMVKALAQKAAPVTGAAA